MKTRAELEAYLLKIANDLHKGPRIQSAATNDFEIILRAFISAKPPAYTVNRLGEIEVDIEDKKYNLTKILEHHPDLEHFTRTYPTKEQIMEYRNQYQLPTNEDTNQRFSTKEEIAELENIANEHFRKLTAYRLALDKAVPVNDRENMVIYEVSVFGISVKKGELCLDTTTQGLDCIVGSGTTSALRFSIPWADLPATFPRSFSSIEDIQAYLPQIIEAISKVKVGLLTEAEARAVKYLTMEDNSNKAYEKINRFLRLNGKISDLQDKNTADLRTILFQLAYLPSAIQKLREHGSEEIQTVHRGETYLSARIANDVIHTRTKNPLVSAPGFISTSKKQDIGQHFSKISEGLTPVNISVTQLKNSSGVDISLFAENPDEGEVLLMPGTQKLYIVNPENNTELLCIPVRSINEIYSHNYDRNIIQWRGEIIKIVDDYSKTASPDNAFINLVDEFCNSVSIYKAGEFIHTLQACREFLRKAGTVNPANEEMRKTQDTIISMAKNIEKYLSSIIANEIKENNADLIQAAQYTYEHYYKYPYKDLTLSAVDHSVSIEDTKIERPNHGLAHSLRKALFMPVITNLLKSHVKDDDFKNFLSSLDQFKMTILQISMVFSRTGRESEVSSDDNSEAYNNYREKSQFNFLQYVKEAGLSVPDFNNKENAYLNVMLNLAHQLDLMRCLNLEEFQSAMAKMNSELSSYVDTEYYTKAMPVLYKMANDSIIATGDRQCVIYDDRLTANKKVYDVRFIDASTNAVKCIEMCITSNPIFSEVNDGKLNVSLPSKKFTASPFQQAVLNADMVKIKELLTDPKLQTEDYAFLIRFTLDVCPEIRPASYKPPEDTTSANFHNLNPADTVAALHLALTKNRPLQALYLIEKGVDVSHVNEAGETALYLAAKNNMSDLVKELIDLQCDVNLTNKDGISPIAIALQSRSWSAVYKLLDASNIILSNVQCNEIFNYAVYNNREDIAATILQNKFPIDLDETVYKMKNPLIVILYLSHTVDAIMDPDQKHYFFDENINKNLDLLNLLIKNDSANTINIDAINSHGNSLMHLAIANDHAELLQTLLQRNARFDVVNPSSRQTPVSSALRYNKTAMLDIILKHFREKEAEQKIGIMRIYIDQNVPGSMVTAFNQLYSLNDSATINHKESETGKTILHYASEYDRVDLISVILASNPDVNIVDKDNFSPLALAAVHGNEQAVRLLTKHGASLLTNTVDSIYQASKKLRWNIIELLLELPDSYKQPSSTNEDASFTIFTMACRVGKVDIIRRMLVLGASAEFSPDAEQKFSPLYNAIFNGKIEVVEILLKLKEVDATRLIDKKSLVTIAAKARHYDIVAKLLEVPGIKIDPIVQGKPLIMHLVKANRHDLVEKLLPYFAGYLNYIDESGKSALHYAAEAGNVKIIEALIKHGANINAQIKASDMHTSDGLQIIKHSDNNTATDCAANRSQWDAVTVLLNAKEINPAVDEPHYNASQLLLLAVTNSQYELANRVVMSKKINIQYISAYKIRGKEQLSTDAMKILAQALDDHEVNFIKTLFEKSPPPAHLIDLAIELAISYQHLYKLSDLISHLLELGFSIHTKNSGLLLHAVVNARREDLLEILLKNGADTTVRNKEGLTIFEIPDLPPNITTLLALYKKPQSLAGNKATLFTTDANAEPSVKVDEIKAEESGKNKHL